MFIFWISYVYVLNVTFVLCNNFTSLSKIQLWGKQSQHFRSKSMGNSMLVLALGRGIVLGEVVIDFELPAVDSTVLIWIRPHTRAGFSWTTFSVSYIISYSLIVWVKSFEDSTILSSDILWSRSAKMLVNKHLSNKTIFTMCLSGDMSLCWQ